MKDYFKIGPVSTFDRENSVDSSFVVLQKIDRIPPHLGMIINGYYADINIKGSTINLPAMEYMRTLKLKHIPAILIEISLQKNQIDFSEICLTLEKVETDKTCLTPIKSYFETYFNESLHHINYIFDLIPFLEKKNLIKNIYGINTDELVVDNYFYLKKYSLDTINNCINKLTLKNAGKSKINI
ncbi:MAG: hypothetical protein Kow0079_13570 [Vicingaceae bacterium]